EESGDEETHNPKGKNPQQGGSIDEWDMDYDNAIGNIIALLDDSDSNNRKGIKIKSKAKSKSDIDEIKKELSKKSDNLSSKKKDSKNDDLKHIANEVKKKSIDKPKKDIEYDIPKENIEIKDFGKNKTVYEMDPDVVKLGNVYQKNELMPHVLFMSILGFVFGIWLARWRFYNSL
ncbi:MAG: hypothetical protein Q4P31_02995, partial [Andreesenia angusta]|nr:hypothetical protein [Andreesenia angusta]